MPRYYFDVQDQNKVTADDVGIECETPDDVRKTAIGALPGIAADALPDGDRHVLAVLVRDESGKKVFEASLTLEARWVG